MADDVDIAADLTERFLADAVQNAKKVERRNPDFCDCESWLNGCQFCGEPSCPLDYAKLQRINIIKGGGNAS